jgi:hypothetical protein
VPATVGAMMASWPAAIVSSKSPGTRPAPERMSSTERTCGLGGGAANWGELLARMANVGVVIRIAGPERSRRARARRTLRRPTIEGLLNGQGIADNCTGCLDLCAGGSMSLSSVLHYRGC